MYLSIGNIDKSTRRKPSARATVLIGYIPVSKLECFSQKSRRKVEGFRLFHRCMRSMLESLVKAGRDGVEMTCADGRVRRVFPILAAYVADHPEQCLISCCQENYCPKCAVEPGGRGEPSRMPLKSQDTVSETLREAAGGEKPAEFKAMGLRAVAPFWSDLPHSNIFSCITPDIFHQLHKGVFKDHMVSWATQCTDGGAAEVDRRFRSMTRHPELRHFKKGISLISQWTGAEYKNMEKVFLPVIAGAASPEVARAVRAVLDFIHYAHFEVHTDDSLAKMRGAWEDFHKSKHVFVVRGVRDDFNIPKVHSMEHYVASIRLLGTADGYSTESPERLHIDYAKLAYDASNKQSSYTEQMTTWLNRQDAVLRFKSYLTWLSHADENPTSPEDSDHGTSAHSPASVDDTLNRPAPAADRSHTPSEGLDSAKSGCASEPDGTEDKSRHKNAEDHSRKIEKIKVSGYAIANAPAKARMAVALLIQQHGAVNFIQCLNEHLLGCATSRATSPAEIKLIHARFLPVHHLTRIAVYHRFDLLLPLFPQVTMQPTLDAVHASPGHLARGTKHAAPPRFSTVLVDTSPPGEGVKTHSVQPITSKSCYLSLIHRCLIRTF